MDGRGWGGLGMGCQWLAGLDGRGWGVGMGCQWLAGLVYRVCLCAIWKGGAGRGVGDGLPMVSRVSL